ncbi:hypothetical protein Corgl_1789 [Coriobacterium glomerans PW2]|uniref:Class B sortase n=1 Tax=Coriobacterium glomerans (strain ATCC 49209 / DSM 20642 / JCM 10262 / PW2) TaxID=700015 RepID=F2N9D6_CORGP|nr:class B sortase [Coriobacterium glomerans]AEB07884.1 hypothetical protein Corgl_1789 [Coriobacterium glomerans PW2]
MSGRHQTTDRGDPRRRVLLCAATLLALVSVETCSIQASFQQMAQMHNTGVDAESTRYREIQGTRGDAVPEMPRILVRGTEIDYSIAQDRSDLADGFFLSHDPSGAPRRSGCPFIDRRSSLDARHILIYGHNLGAGSGMFSELEDAWHQRILEAIGDAVLYLPDGTTTEFSPICAERVNERYADVQRFGFSDEADLREWVCSIARESQAAIADWHKTAGNARRVLTLVTCSSARPSERLRTLIVFASST